MDYIVDSISTSMNLFLALDCFTCLTTIPIWKSLSRSSDSTRWMKSSILPSKKKSMKSLDMISYKAIRVEIQNTKR